MRKLIVTADDFGLSVSVNQAIEDAHKNGVLTAASLMMGAEATADAIARAKRLPSLRVGLHLVLVDGRPLSPPEKVPGLLNGDNYFLHNITDAGFRFFFSWGIRAQIEAEIRAQFEAFRKTGLPLDHVNAHKHMHLHPTILELILKVGREFGLKAVRLPNEPVRAMLRSSERGTLQKLSFLLFLYPWVTILKSRLLDAGVKHNEFLFGLTGTGNMDTETVLEILEKLPNGVSEIYFHPAAEHCAEIKKVMPDYQCKAEHQTLTHPSFQQALTNLNIEKIAFADLP